MLVLVQRRECWWLAGMSCGVAAVVEEGRAVNVNVLDTLFEACFGVGRIGRCCFQECGSCAREDSKRRDRVGRAGVGIHSLITPNKLQDGVDKNSRWYIQ